MNIYRNLLSIFFMMVSLLLTGVVRADDQPQSIVQMLDYIGVDYQKTVKDHKVINQAEYKEQVEFSRQINLMILNLPDYPEKNAMQSEANALEAMVNSKESADKIAAKAAMIKTAIINNFAVATSPKRMPRNNTIPSNWPKRSSTNPS